jgi:hypothetical protein
MGIRAGRGRRRCMTPSGTSPRTGGARARPSSGTCPAAPARPAHASCLGVSSEWRLTPARSSHIAGARYYEQPGDHSLRFAASGDSAALCAEIAGFLAARLRPGDPDRMLVTILCTKTKDWPEPAARDLVRSYRGRLIRTGRDEILATFDAPGRAIRCAAAVLADAAAAGTPVRAGIHTGEVDLVGEDIAGAWSGSPAGSRRSHGPRRSWSPGPSRIW